MINGMPIGNSGIENNPWIALPLQEEEKTVSSRESVSASKAQGIAHISPAAQTNLAGILRANMVMGFDTEVADDFHRADQLQARLTFRPEKGQNATVAAVDRIERVHRNPPKASLN